MIWRERNTSLGYLISIEMTRKNFGKTMPIM